jgi:single-stranded-DNA-specific exonuclease
LDQENQRRKNIDETTLEEALEMIEQNVDLTKDKAIVLASCGWHPGVIGIVASRLVERYHRPALLIAVSEGMGKGSGRSVEALNLWEALRDCAGVLTRFGGHHYAAGFGVRQERIAELRRRFGEAAENRLTMEQLVRHIEADGEARLAELTPEVVNELHMLAPFGMGNPAPTLVSRGLQVEEARRVGDGSHLSLRLREEKGGVVGAIWFGEGELQARLPAGSKVDVCYRPSVDEWKGTTRVRLHLEDAAVWDHA